MSRSPKARYLHELHRDWPEAEFTAAFRLLFQLLHDGIGGARARDELPGGTPAEHSDVGDMPYAMLADLLAATCDVLAMGDLARLRLLHDTALGVLAAQDVVQPARIHMYRHRARATVMHRRGQASQVEVLVGELRDHVAQELLDDAPREEIADFLAAIINDRTIGLTSDCLPLKRKKVLVRQELSTLSKRAPDARAVVRAAFRALGYLGPVLLRAEDMAQSRQRAKKKSMRNVPPR